MINKYSPHLYHWFIRPKIITKKYIHQLLHNYFQFEGQTVLDFGSGTGANSIIFSPRNYIGVDPDHQRIAFAKRKYPAYHFLSLRNHALPIPSNSIHHILIIAVLHHIPSDEIDKYLDEFKRILKPSGSMIVLEPCFDKNKPYCNQFMKWFDKGEYIRFEQAYLSLFENKGYQCQVLERFSKCFLYNELFFTVQMHGD